MGTLFSEDDGTRVAVDSYACSLLAWNSDYVSGMEKEMIEITVEEVCTQIINRFGFLVVGTFVEYKIGERVKDLMILQHGRDEDKLNYPFVVVGEATKSEYYEQYKFVREVMKVYDGGGPMAFPRYYKVLSD